MIDTKTYFAYTPQDYKIYHIFDTRKPDQCKVKNIPYGERATIALSIINSEIHYGVAICDNEDKFDKASGRKLAEDRMYNEFGKIPMSNFKFKNKLTADQIALYILNNLTNSVYQNLGKYKIKIKKHTFYHKGMKGLK